MSSGALTLSNVAARTDVLAVACKRCTRAGKYKVSVLIERYGSEFALPALLRMVSADCPKRGSTDIYDLCGVHCPKLPELFGLNPVLDNSDQRNEQGSVGSLFRAGKG